MTGDREAALTAALGQIDRAFGKGGTGELPAQPKTMTERVARVLFARDFPPVDGVKFEDLSEPERDEYIGTAREIFGAMGSPTEEMLDDAEGWQPKDSYQDLETAREQIEFLWGVMLDCAEAELSEETLAREARAAEWAGLSAEEQAARWAKFEAEHGPQFQRHAIPSRRAKTGTGLVGTKGSAVTVAISDGQTPKRFSYHTALGVTGSDLRRFA